KLGGSSPPNPPQSAEVPQADIGMFPPPMNCSSLGIKPLAIPTQPPYYRPSDIVPSIERAAERRRNASD
ncbi:MAG: hypothetical protein JOY69_07305, partial [Candidatus Eremiobacteraeota bacterium]|nr:hypothetical protein [Candidatus Eremiobacteraeota bacterium]